MYTYCSDYNTASIDASEGHTVSQINRDEEKQKWLTEDGFKVSISKTGLQSNRHPLKPDDARMSELGKVNERWNYMGVNIMQLMLK